MERDGVRRGNGEMETEMEIGIEGVLFLGTLTNKGSSAVSQGTSAKRGPWREGQ